MRDGGLIVGTLKTAKHFKTKEHTMKSRQFRSVKIMEVQYNIKKKFNSRLKILISVEDTVVELEGNWLVLHYNYFGHHYRCIVQIEESDNLIIGKDILILESHVIVCISKLKRTTSAYKGLVMKNIQLTPFEDEHILENTRFTGQKQLIVIPRVFGAKQEGLLIEHLKKLCSVTADQDGLVEKAVKSNKLTRNQIAISIQGDYRHEK